MTEILVGFVTQGPIPLMQQVSSNAAPHAVPQQQPLHQQHQQQQNPRPSTAPPSSSRDAGSHVDNFSDVRQNFLAEIQRGITPPGYANMSRAIMNAQAASRAQHSGDCVAIYSFLDARLKFLEHIALENPMHVRQLIQSLNWLADAIGKLFSNVAGSEVESKKNELVRRVNHLTRHWTPLNVQNHSNTQGSGRTQCNGLANQAQRLNYGVEPLVGKQSLAAFTVRLKQCIQYIQTTKEMENAEKLIPTDPCDKLQCAGKKLDRIITFLKEDIPCVEGEIEVQAKKCVSDLAAVPHGHERGSSGLIAFSSSSEPYGFIDNFVGWIQVNFIDPVQASDLKSLRQDMGKKAEGILARLTRGEMLT